MMVVGAVQTGPPPGREQQVRSVQDVGVLSRVNLALMTTARCSEGINLLLFSALIFLENVASPLCDLHRWTRQSGVILAHSLIAPHPWHVPPPGPLTHFSSFSPLSLFWTVDPEQRNSRNYKYEFHLRRLPNVGEAQWSTWCVWLAPPQLEMT